MGCYIVHYEYKDRRSWGVVVQEDRILPLASEYASLAAFLSEGIGSAYTLANSDPGCWQESVALADVHLLSPVTSPCRIVCQGTNYADHLREAGQRLHKQGCNLLFSKADSSLSGARDPIIRPKHVQLLDYEAELGLVIGRAMTESIEVTAATLHEYIAGLVIVNDVTARDVQLLHGQWYKGKSYRTFCPTGPFLYLLESHDVQSIGRLEVMLWVNGELRQRTTTAQWLFTPEITLTELSGLMDLSPGDLLLTGTPGGVALQAPGKLLQMIGRVLFSPAQQMELFVHLQRTNTRYLREGDLVRCAIKSPDGRIDLGVQENRILLESNTLDMHASVGSHR